jgi:N-acetylmuramoyl-L-alanine amidase
MLWVQFTLGALILGLARPLSSTQTPSSQAPAPRQVGPAPYSSPRADSARPRAPLSIRVVYPKPEDRVRARDSSFLLGSVSTGDVRLRINGSNVRVWPNGGWLAWVPFPPDSVMQFRIEAFRGLDTQVVVYPVRRDSRDLPGEVRSGAVWIDTASLSPWGQAWLPRTEYVTLSARAAEGADVRLHLPNGSTLRLLPQRRPQELPPSIRAFERDTTKHQTPDELRYVGTIRGTSLGPSPGPVLGGLTPALLGALARAALRCVTGAPCPAPYTELAAADAGWAVIEASLRGDTVRARWPLQLALLDTLPLVVELDDDTLGTGKTDSIVQGRAVPGGSYHWFFPTGTHASVSGRLNEDVRIRLSPTDEAWIPAIEARLLPLGVPAPRAVARSVTLTPMSDRVMLRVPLTDRIPFQLTENDRSLTLTFYNAVADVDWIHHEGDSLVQRMAWIQTSRDELSFTVELASPVWGYRTRWSRNDLVLEIRRPPRILKSDPLRRRVVALDPGHPPLGATGPTGLREAEANLAVALRLRALLRAAGARVVMTRTADTAVDLWSRVAIAETAGAELLVSIHNDALPDGVNPFTNNGTGVFYNRPRSVPLAAAIQRSLVRRLGLPDRGISRGDLAVARATWMPSVICEGMFLILPDREAALRSARGQRLYAQGVFEGIRQFLRDRAQEQASPSVGQGKIGASPKANSVPSLREAAGAGPVRSVDP